MDKIISQLQPNEHYGCGTRLRVVYTHDGITESQTCILANTFEDPFLFQVISIDGYHSGSVEGYIRRQYDQDELNMTNICSGSHLLLELKERVFQNIKSIDLVK
ncbi:MAG: hypothetical protein KDC57_05535 [Saprospiraceae bacterium]|nr:hypothetical protein [Saprospiraceae bacterium]MCB0695088.1 hypothetical protein [Saprospiraceae bacterium]MCB9312741.1 hypothetical protein [Lewinellaceae bacterium]